MDEIADLADRAVARYRRGEDWEFEFGIDWESLPPVEQVDIMALLYVLLDHAEEKLEAVSEDVRIAKLLLRRDVGQITAREFVEQVRGVVPDSLGQPS